MIKTFFTMHWSSFDIGKGDIRGAFFIFRRSFPLHVSLPAGYSNTGTSPQKALAQIRNLLGYHNIALDHTDETMLGIMMIIQKI